MKIKTFFLDAALTLIIGLFIIDEAVLPDVLLNLKAGRSLEYFSALGRGTSSPEKVYFVKAIYTSFPEVYSAAYRSHPVVHPVSLERVAP